MVSHGTIHYQLITIHCRKLEFAIGGVSIRIIDVNGILIIDKPADTTSHDVVSRVRRILHTKRVGHTGTLDPFATGVMVILVGQATRLAQFLDKDAKEYQAMVRFGFETDTGDRTGTRRGDAETQRPRDELTVADVKLVLPQFTGEIQQTPPMYSAKKIDGKKLYEHARKGETVERKANAVTIHKLEIFGENLVRDSGILTWDLGLRVVCSAGTYIRTLAEDIGRKLDTGAHLTELRRTAAGKFSLHLSITLEHLGDLEDPTTALIPMTDAVSHLAKFTVREDRVDKTRNGLSTRVFDAKFTDGEPIQMLDAAGEMIAIGFFDSAENIIQPKVVLV